MKSIDESIFIVRVVQCTTPFFFRGKHSSDITINIIHWTLEVNLDIIHMLGNATCMLPTEKKKKKRLTVYVMCES